MDPQYVGGTTGTVASRASLSLTVPASFPVGALMVFTIEVDQSHVITPPAGWTQEGQINNATVSGAVFSKRVAAGEPGAATGNFTWAAADFSQGSLDCWQGEIASGSYNDAATTQNGATTGTSATCLSVTTATNKDKIIAIAVNIDGGAHTPPAGMSERVDTNCVTVCDLGQASAGATGNKVITVPLAGYAAFLLAITPAAPVAQADVILTRPEASAGVSPTSAGSIWGFGSWVTILALGWDFDIALFGVSFQTQNTPTLDTTAERLIELGTGAAGSEATIAQIPYSFRDDTAVGYFEDDDVSIFLPEPVVVTKDTRLAVRAADDLVAAVPYGAFKIYFREIAAAGGGTVVLSAVLSAAGGIVAPLSVSKPLAAALSGQGALVPDLRVAKPLAAALAGQGALVPNLRITKPLVAQLGGQGSVTAALGVEKRLSAVLGGQGGVAAALDVAHSVALSAVVAGGAAISAALDVGAAIVGSRLRRLLGVGQ